MSRGVASLRAAARLLLAQVSVSDLQKAQARSFGHAKRRARIAAAAEENKLPPAAKRSLGLNSRMKPATGKPASGGGDTGSGGGNNSSGGSGGSASGSGNGSGSGSSGGLRDDGVSDATADVLSVAREAAAGQPEGAEDAERGSSTKRLLLPKGDTEKKQPGTDQTMPPPPSPSSSCCPDLCPANACPACRRVVIGHPLDVIRYRCGGRGGAGGGGCAATGRNRKGGEQQHLAAGEADAAAARAAGTGAVFQVAPAAGADERFLVKQGGFGDHLNSAGGNGAGSSGTRRGKRSGGVGAAAVSEVSCRR